MTANQINEIIRLTKNHELAVDTGLGIIKIIDDIFKKMKLENTHENRQIIAEQVVNSLLDTGINVINEEETYDLGMINWN